jgi:type I restriction enzyme R subunit
MAKNKTISVKGTEIGIYQGEASDYISLTDIARHKDGANTDAIIQNWLRNRNTIELLGFWELMYNPDFKPLEFEGFRKQAGLNSFVLTPKKWIETTNAIGIISKSGRYGGSFAHKDIAFEFASWISIEFKLYIIKEFQRLKEDESDRLKLTWNLQRTLMTWEYSEDNLIEQTAIDLFFNQLGWDTLLAYNKEGFGEGSTLGRLNKKEVVLKKIFFEKIKEFNPGLPQKAYEEAYEKLIEESITKSLAEINYEKHQLLRNGIPVDFINEKGEQVKNKTLKVFDFDNADNNNFLAVRQLWLQGKSNRERRPDIIGFVNGIPLLFIELKAAHRKLENAYNDNFTDYKDVIPKLFYYNAFVLLSNGIESRIGSVTGKYQHFHEWKRITEEDEGIVALDRIIVGVCEKKRFLDLFENFILFDNSLGKVVKLIARNHQFIGVNKAIENIQHKEQLYKLGKISLEEKQKLGVFWHTQGSGKSYSMVFFCQKIHHKFTGSYTFLIVTDRNELDTQIYGTFSGIGAVPQVKAGSKDSLKANSGKHLRELLSSEHRYLFTLIHKFNFEEEITKRDNIIVISDEAHRTQGGNLAMNLRNALPNASFIGFTGTPLFKDDEITKRIFGDYVSRYDFKRSVDDGATVPLYYENRGEYLGLKNPVINEQIRAVIDAESEDLDSDQRSRVEQLFAREYPILTAKKRLDAIAKDAVWHFCNRGYKGKGMFIALDKLTAVRMYDLITHHWKLTVEQLEKKLPKENMATRSYWRKAENCNG